MSDLFDNIAKGVVAGGTALSGLGSIFSGFATQQANKDNLQFQRENLEYMKGVQRTTWDREDNAVQRRANDLKLAGMNPLLAAGGAAQTSAPVRTDAPQNDVRAAGGAASGFATAGSKLSDTAAQLLQMKQDFAVKDAQIHLLNEQARDAGASADTKLQLLPGVVDLQSSQTGLNLTTANVAKANNMFKLAELDEFKKDANATVEAGLRQLSSDRAKQEYEWRYNQLRLEGAQQLIKAGIDKDVAESLSAVYASQMAGMSREVQEATVPAHIAGPYADLLGKVTHSASDISNIMFWTKKFIGMK